MAITLQKGGNISLSKTDPSLTKVLVGLGWDPRPTDGSEFDLDASVFALGANGKVRSEADFIFYNQPKSVDGAIFHTGDNRSGAGEGDDESIKIDLSKLAADIVKMPVIVTIHDAVARKQNFGQVGNAFIRLVNEVSGQEIVRYDLGEDYATEIALNFGELYRHNGEWKFRAVGQGYSGGLDAVCREYGINPIG